MIDVNDLRRPAILLHGLARADRPYSLFYDETNNIRRLHLETGAFNAASLDCFVLGGVAQTPGAPPIDLAPLRIAARIQPSAKELKFELFGKGDFIDALGSQKVRVFLEWAEGQSLLIHYLALDPFYWSVVDIVDSILVVDATPLQMFGPQLKSDLNRVLRENLADTAALLAAFDYPSIAPDRREAFINALLERLEAAEDRLEHFSYQMLKGVLQMGRRASTLPFIEDEEPRVLIDAFTHFFLERMAILKSADHVFDTEKTIVERLAKLDLRDGDQPFQNYRFVERSHDEPGVQAADVAVGLLGKMFSWIIATDDETLQETRASLSPLQVENLRALSVLMDRSTDENAAFANSIISLADQHKAGWFLRS